ncbi:hypothetical protein [Sandaracinus amylolyticus]|uniref:hypothetical protein n=1 Tax=Sandaracinus amylolyticus TaxID=927083 RepID=UPI001F3AF0D3|nr:hypothetical protein [Sandaracinus amylolyticus]UJR80152.1 Hypothetical protein I5071_21960 [Sandaracinus amylolyticus]
MEPCQTTGELRLGRVCWNPTGSRWHLTAMAPGGEYAFDVELLAANRLRSTDHPAASPATDEWYVDGNTIRMFLQNRFVEYRADVSNGTVIVGDAQNVRGETWQWRGDRMQVGGGCHPDETQQAETCINLAGTQWTLQTSSGERVIHFEAGGALLTDQGAISERNRWSQQGAQLQFSLDGVEYTATVERGDALSGTAGGAQWSATPVQLFAPPMH